jgi:hypothetical protein
MKGVLTGNGQLCPRTITITITITRDEDEDERIRTDTDTGTDTSSERRPIEKIHDIANVLLVGHAFEGFFRERNNGAQMLREMTK